MFERSLNLEGVIQYPCRFIPTSCQAPTPTIIIA